MNYPLNQSEVKMTQEMDPQLRTIIDNMPEKTGRSLEAWFAEIEKAGLEAHTPIMKLLKGDHGVTHGFANTISNLYRQRQEGGPAAGDDLIQAQYSKKPGLKPFYDRLIKEVQAFGDDVELAPKKAYVSLRRAKQFAILQPSTKSRMDVGINLKGAAASGALLEGDKWSGMCTHHIQIHSLEDVNEEVIGWLRKAYESAD
jgi:predicted transport protein